MNRNHIQDNNHKRIHSSVLMRLFSLFLILMLGLSLISCSSGGSEDSEGSEGTEIEEPDVIDEDDSSPGIAFEEEAEDEDLHFIKSEDSDFYGTWSATSDLAEYYYGNFTITINPDGTWKGDITDEPMTGKWTRDGNFINITNEYIDLTLAFADTGNLILRRNVSDETGDEEDEFINTVLIRQ